MTPRLTRLTAYALYEMLHYDLTHKRFGFHFIRQRLMARKTANRQTHPQTVERVCEAVNLAAALYVKPVRCLQKSVVTRHMLRKLGVEAFMVIGYRPSPFFSHAWIEVEGQVVNESPVYKEQLKLLWTI